MTEHDLRNLLLEYEATNTVAHPGNASQGSSGRLFISFMRVLTVLFWLLAAMSVGLYLVYSVAFLEEFVHGRRALTNEYVQIAIVCALGVVATIVVASVSTLVLMFTARAERLRRINSGLFEILSQLLQHKRSE